MNDFKNLETLILKKIISNCKMNIELIDNYIYEINERRYGLNIAINTIKSTYHQAVTLEILIRALRDKYQHKKDV
jgi:hypothetical protein